MEGHLDDRADRDERHAHQRTRDADTLKWFDRAAAPEVRLPAFDRWLRVELERRLDWTWAGPAKDRRVEQCRLQIDGLVIELWRRGWMLDGHRLAKRIEGMLDAIAKAQRSGQVRDFWPYFKATVERYVGLNAEEIQAEAMSAGVAVGAVLQQLTRRLPQGPSLPELVAQRAGETLRERLARQRRQEALKAAEKAQLSLL